MTDRPVIMSAASVRAILAGTKTETRRIVRPQPPTPEQFRGSDFGMSRCVADGIKMYSQNDHDRLPKHPTDWELCGSVGVARDAGFPDRYRIPYAAGDRLWLREAWAPISPDEHERPIEECRVEYRADTTAEAPGHWDAVGRSERPGYARWRPSTHMPRWASRITLAVAEVRVERLREITNEGAIAEGCQGHYRHPDEMLEWVDPYEEYAELWDSLHGEGAWNANPWVSVVRFVPTLANIDAGGA